jgi:hypothetical protein
MANHRGASRRLRYFTSALLALAVLPATLPAKEKLKPEQLVALHLDSIGPAEARAAAKSRVFRGKGMWRVMVGGRGQVPGNVFQASDGTSSSFRFDTQGNPSYYGEHLIYTGEDVRVFQGFQNGRSHLGDFFESNHVILREGLLGGVTSTAWALLSVDSRNPKLKYSGLKKVDDRKLHRLDYKARKRAGSTRIHLFFEPETYRHVQTSYRYEVPAGLASDPQAAVNLGADPDASARQQRTYLNVTETFSNFREIDGLMLPANWTIHYNRTGAGSVVSEWEMGFASAVHNEPIDPSYYTPGTKAP